MYKEEYLQQKKKRKTNKLTAKDMQAQNDPMYQLWQELQDQDEELIFSESTQLINDFNYSSVQQKFSMTSMSNMYTSGIESSRAHMSMQDVHMKSKGGEAAAVYGSPM